MKEHQTGYTIILLIIGVLFIIWGIFGLMDAENYSYSGYNTDGNNTITEIKEGSPAELAGMQVGDIMKSYDGILVTDSKSFSNRKRTEIGQTVEIRVDRSGDEKTLQVSYIAMPKKNSALNISSFIMGLLFVFLGLFVHAKKQTALTLTFAIFGLFFGMITFNGPNIDPGFLRNLVSSVNSTIVLLAFVALARFILQYPVKSSFLNGGKSPWLFVPAALMIVVIWILIFASPERSSTLNISLNMMLFAVIVFYFGTALIALIIKYLKASIEERSQLGLNYMLLGATLGILPSLIFIIINRITPTTVIPGSEYLFLTLAFVPIFFSVALLRKSYQIS